MFCSFYLLRHILMIRVQKRTHVLVKVYNILMDYLLPIYIFICRHVSGAAEAWWAHNPQVPGLKNHSCESVALTQF